MIDEVVSPPSPPAGPRNRFLFAIGAVVLAALVVVALVWWAPGTGGHRTSGAAASRSSAVAGPPDGAVTASPLIAAAVASVVRVTGTARSCGRRLRGSGFVYAANRVMTPAHVVAGVRGSPTVDDWQGRSFKATVVIFDPGRDLAVLRVPGLTARALPFRQKSHVGDAGVIIGYARSGGLTETPARLRWMNLTRGPDIYHRRITARQVFTLYGGIGLGMSGGPLVATDGTVSGMVFAADLMDSRDSYALAASELGAQADAGRTAVSAVSTGGCSA
ncbi:trypsin-like peptidase domain-containing protein [Actinoallomurus acaciae]|uniref:Trypsin-like peptidase domain-containing protein n=1 Tax=Actinoallomurus acaciae TaxID=502577 RepID=A0ABV5YKA7_9ACTN